MARFLSCFKEQDTQWLENCLLLSDFYFRIIIYGILLIGKNDRNKFNYPIKKAFAYLHNSTKNEKKKRDFKKTFSYQFVYKTEKKK